MKKPAWVDAVEEWLGGKWFDIVEWTSPLVGQVWVVTKKVPAEVVDLVGRPQVVPWLSFVATAAAAVATIYSYRASQQSADVSARAQAFAEKVSQDQIALSRPVLSVMGGRFDKWVEGEGSQLKTTQRLELVIRNSGARSALPAWLGIYSQRGAPSSRRSTFEVAWPVTEESAEIPSSSEAKVYLNLGSVDQPPQDLLLAMAYGDDTPQAAGAASASEAVLEKRCSSVKVVWLHAARTSDGAASAPGNWSVVSATPMLLLESVTEGRTAAEAAADHFTRQLKDKAICTVLGLRNPS